MSDGLKDLIDALEDAYHVHSENTKLREALAVYAHKGYWNGNQFILVPVVDGVVVEPSEIAIRALERNE